MAQKRNTETKKKKNSHISRKNAIGTLKKCDTQKKNKNVFVLNTHTHTHTNTSLVKKICVKIGKYQRKKSHNGFLI